MTRRAGLLLLHTPTPLRAWTGVGELDLPADATDTTGGTYLGLGELVGWPAIAQMINGRSERITFTLSGVDPTVLALADEEADDVRGAEGFLGIASFDEAEQLTGSRLWLRKVRADTIGGRGNVASASITLSLGDAFSGRRRPALAFYTDADQRRRSPDDAVFNRVSLYNSGHTVKWPN